MRCVLCKGELLTLESKEGIEAITVIDGQVWITRPDDARDYCLEAGARLPACAAGKLIVEALQPATLILSCKEPGSALNITVAWKGLDGVPGAA